MSVLKYGDITNHGHKFATGRWFIKTRVFDVFTGKGALGNPCGVVRLDDWPSDPQLLQIAQHVGQPVTSFVVNTDGQFQLRWFSLQSEINLCGHGSLGAGAAILAEKQEDDVTFYSQYGNVTISKQNDLYGITLPSWTAQPCVVPKALSNIADQAIDVFLTRDLVLVLPDQQAVSAFEPDFQQLKPLKDFHALIVTAQGDDCDYVLRYFAPSIGIDEDLATGSAQCSLAPYWFRQLDRDRLTVRQLSLTGGYFEVERNTNNLINVYAKVNAREGANKSDGSQACSQAINQGGLLQA